MLKNWRAMLKLKMPKTAKPPTNRMLYEAGNWWPLILTSVILLIGSSLVVGLQLIEQDSARWGLSALIQAGATLAGILFVALGLLWTRTNMVREKLTGLLPLYTNVFHPTSEASNAIKTMFVQSIQGDSFKNNPYKMYTLRECCWRFAVLRNASAIYHGFYRSSKEISEEASALGIAVHKFAEEQIRGLASSLSTDANLFFKYLIELDMSISFIRSDLEKKDDSIKYIDETMYKAINIDEVGVSMSKISFFKELSGGKLKAISFLWLLCISMGLLMLAAIDNISPDLIMIPMVIGILAIGVTLSVILQSISSID